MIRRLIFGTSVIVSLAVLPALAGTGTGNPGAAACDRACVAHDLDAALRAVFNRKQACAKPAGEGLPLPWPFPWRCPPTEEAEAD